MNNYRGYGDRLTVPANVITSAVTAGQLVEVDVTHGVAVDDGDANDPNVLLLEGTFQLAKLTGAGTGGAIGSKAQATGAANLITGGAGTYVGFFAATAGDNDATALVTLLGRPA